MGRRKLYCHRYIIGFDNYPAVTDGSSYFLRERLESPECNIGTVITVVIETRDANCESNLTGAIPAILLKEPVKVAAIPPITDVFIKLRRLIEFIANDFSLQR